MRSITAPASGWFLCLATVIDLASRHPTGRPIADHLRTDLVIYALTACGYTFVTVPQLLVPAGLSRARSTAEAPGPPPTAAAVIPAPLMGRFVPPRVRRPPGPGRAGAVESRWRG